MFKQGKWLAVPPKYEPIMNGLEFAQPTGNGLGGKEGGNTRASNLEMYIDMTSESDGREFKGRVLSLDEFRATFTGGMPSK